jgi:hypothetical protein
MNTQLSRNLLPPDLHSMQTIWAQLQLRSQRGVTFIEEDAKLCEDVFGAKEKKNELYL